MLCIALIPPPLAAGSQESGERVSAELFTEAQSVKSLLRSSLGWEFDLKFIGAGSDSDDEDMPTMVEDATKFYL